MVEINVKCSNGTKFSIACTPEQTVAELKTALEAQSGVEAAQMRLIYRGHILKDGNTLGSYCNSPFQSQTYPVPVLLRLCCIVTNGYMWGLPGSALRVKGGSLVATPSHTI
jgi:hypothetical protein